MADEPERVQTIRAVFSGIKELILAVAALATIWIQASNTGKLDTAAATTKLVETKLEATTANTDRRLDEILHDAAGGRTAAEASALSWKAWKSKDEEDMSKADAAIVATEKSAK